MGSFLAAKTKVTVTVSDTKIYFQFGGVFILRVKKHFFLPPELVRFWFGFGAGNGIAFFKQNRAKKLIYGVSLTYCY